MNGMLLLKKLWITSNHFLKKYLSVVFVHWEIWEYTYSRGHSKKNKYKMKNIRILIITAHRRCISTMRQCMYLCIYIVHVQGVDQNNFGHEIKLHTVLLYIDSIFTIQGFTFSQTDWHIIFQCSDTYCDVKRVGTLLNPL